ncbi:PREDICTED: uncharacterized protein LOC109243355 isoform X2 [Nicotiana attenuata]|uniref:Uncharacterized protein n=1 Tax=Nicotiana attenuata TaxID=49451 RepID=A0A314L1E5_NICAT|nr:PREDICTED: uncharacterized protein LOC109243355 isoform X2 [Nicotiana attenuata]OIT35456.1 hypothetical protein A4A49_03411 [Nicotiana attenuata]
MFISSVMERSEPTLAPQWLRSGRHVTGSVTASSPLHSDDPAPSKLANSRSLSTNMSNNKLRHPAASDRAISSHTRWNSNSSSPNLRSYSSFRSPRHRNMDKDINKYHEKSTLGNHRSRDLPDTSRNHRWEIFEEEGLRRSQSMIYGRFSEKGPKNLGIAGKIDPTDKNGPLASVNSVDNGPLASVNSVDNAIDRGIQPLVTEERQASPGFGRVRSPGLGTMPQGLPIGSSGTTGNKSASSLADITVVAGNNNPGLSSVKQGASSGLSSPISSKAISRGLNMAETVARGPPCAQTTSQLSHANQRLEELAMKQSRQLIPLKPLVPNPSDKPRAKVEQLQQTVSSSIPVNHSLSTKLNIFKPTRENVVSYGVNSSLSPNAHSKRSNTLLTAPASASTQSLANNAASFTSERKPVGLMVEKKLSSQARSRNDFFNLMRKKSIASSSAVNGAGCAVSPPLDKSGVSEVLTAPGIPQDQDTTLSDESPRVEKSTEISGENTCTDDSYEEKNSTDTSFSKSDAILCSEEEEAAFLRSLGWEENADEGGLTEEEISTFYRDVTKYINSKLSFKVMQGVQSRFLLPLHSGIGDVGGISS